MLPDSVQKISGKPPSIRFTRHIRKSVKSDDCKSNAPCMAIPMKLGVPKKRRSSVGYHLTTKKRKFLSEEPSNKKIDDFLVNTPKQSKENVHSTITNEKSESPQINNQFNNCTIGDTGSLLLTPRRTTRRVSNTSDNEHNKICDEFPVNSTSELPADTEASMAPSIEAIDIINSNINSNESELLTSMNNKNNNQDPLQITPLKSLRDELNNSMEENFFLTPTSVDRRNISYDSELERVFDSLKHHDIDITNFSFETIELMNAFQDVDLPAENGTTGLLDSSSPNDGHNNDSTVDPLTMNVAEERKQRKSQRLREKKTANKEEEFDYIYDSVNDKVYCSKRLERLQRDHMRIYDDDSSDSDDIDEVEISKNQKKMHKPMNKNNKYHHKYSSTDDSESDSVDPLDITAQVNAAQETIPEDVIERLTNMTVTLEHEVPPQHKLEKFIGVYPSPKIKKAFTNFSPLKKGKFSLEEDAIIKKNWERFCKCHNWDPEYPQPFITAKYRMRTAMAHTEDRIKFGQFLARDLPQRTLHHVVERFKTLYSHSARRKGFTRDEDKKILTYFRHNVNDLNKVEKLAKLLGRRKKTLRDRYLRLMKIKHGEITGRPLWSFDLVEKFLKQLMDTTLSENIYDLKDEIIPQAVWKKLEMQLKISRRALQRFWLCQLHLQLFCPKPIYENDINIMLIEYMYNKGITHRRELNWACASTHFDGMTSWYLSIALSRLLQQFCRPEDEEFGDTVDWLYEEGRTYLINLPHDKYLPRLSYENGKLKIIDNDQPVLSQT